MVQFKMHLALYHPTDTLFQNRGKVISQACVKNSVHRGRSASVNDGIPTPEEQTPQPTPNPGAASPQKQTPPWEQTSPGPDSPPAQCMFGDTANKRAYGSYWNRILFKSAIAYFLVIYLRDPMGLS